MSVLTEAMKQRIREYFPRYPDKQAVTLPALHLVQDEFRCVPLKAVEEIGELLGLSAAEVFDTMSFYGFFREEKEKLARKRLWVCRSLPCMLKGGESLLKEVCDKLGVHPGQNTSDGAITVEFAECIGACDAAPCVLVDDEIHERVTADQAIAAARGAS